MPTFFSASVITSGGHVGISKTIKSYLSPALSERLSRLVVMRKGVSMNTSSPLMWYVAWWKQAFVKFSSLLALLLSCYKELLSILSKREFTSIVVGKVFKAASLLTVVFLVSTRSK